MRARCVEELDVIAYNASQVRLVDDQRRPGILPGLIEFGVP